MPGFIGEEIEPVFKEEPELEKKTGVPDGFKWRGREYAVTRVIKEWHEYDHPRPGGGWDAGRPPFGARAPMRRGSWGVGKDFYRVMTDDGRLVDIYYDRRPKGRKKGRWVILRELGGTGAGRGSSKT
ncbi:MAG TPA: hypothetical protein DHW14_05510 [Clostridiales bacterium]|nr:hypothetical protein [Clostridiales bacterium]